MLEQQRSLQQVFFVPGKQKKVKNLQTSLGKETFWFSLANPWELQYTAGKCTCITTHLTLFLLFSLRHPQDYEFLSKVFHSHSSAFLPVVGLACDRNAITAWWVSEWESDSWKLTLIPFMVLESLLYQQHLWFPKWSFTCLGVWHDQSQ